MRVSDYIIDFLISKGISDCFGYPGGSITSLLDSIRKRRDSICAHVNYHEQGAAFAACGYAVSSGNMGIAYATGGPGCTNLITGIAQAYYDSIPVLFITGNVNTYECKGFMGIRQRGFQESDNINAGRPFTKYAAYIDEPEKIRFNLEKAYFLATNGRCGPVLLDIPMNIQRAEIEPEYLEEYKAHISERKSTLEASLPDFAKIFYREINLAKRPCLILGNGIKDKQSRKLAGEFVDRFNMPCITSMIAIDRIGANRNYYGFLGAYGTRLANFIVAKSDLLITIGSRLDIRQVGSKRENFAPNSKIIRVDIDKEELKYKVHEDEMSFCLNAEEALKTMLQCDCSTDFSHWKDMCEYMKRELKDIDFNEPNEYISRLSNIIPENAVITTDVGQNQVWVAQSLKIKKDQDVLFSGGLGAMGYALPAAIGAYYGSSKKHIVCICGDGGFQMNIQELQYIARDKLPIKIIVFNNNSLGMIRHFQEMYFNGVYYQTKPEGGYTAPEFNKIASAYGIRSIVINDLNEISKCYSIMKDNKAVLIEIRHFDNTYIIPKLRFGNPNQDQEPLLPRILYDKLMMLE